MLANIDQGRSLIHVMLCKVVSLKFRQIYDQRDLGVCEEFWS